MTDLVKRGTEVLYSTLDKATAVLENFGIKPLEDETTQLAFMLQDLVEVDEVAVTAIGKVLEHQSAVNQFMREEMEEISVSDRHVDISKRFGNIAGDLRDMREYLADDGRIDFGERMSLLTKKLIRGDTEHQFDEIRETFREVTNDTMEHLEKQRTILGTYENFRQSIAAAEVVALQLKNAQGAHLLAAEQEAVAADDIFKAYTGDDEAERRSLRATRDNALGKVLKEKNRFELAGFVAQGFQEGYIVGQTVMKHYAMQHQQLDNMYAKSLTFFTTNSTAFTGLEASVLGAQAVHEATKVQKAQREGTELLMEALKEAGLEGLPEYTRELHGPGVAAERVIGLLNGIEEYVRVSIESGAEQRRLSETNSAEMQQGMDDFQSNVVAIVSEYARQNVKAEELIRAA